VETASAGADYVFHNQLHENKPRASLAKGSFGPETSFDMSTFESLPAIKQGTQGMPENADMFTFGGWTIGFGSYEASLSNPECDLSFRVVTSYAFALEIFFMLCISAVVSGG
jgi:hypothetical protein